MDPGSHQRTTAQAGTGAPVKTAASLLSILQEGRDLDEKIVLGQLQHAISQGAPVNAMQRVAHKFNTALGEACFQGRDQVVRFLLTQGANPHWPGEAEIPQGLLAGDEYGCYEGIEADPLGVAMSEMTWVLAEESLHSTDPQYPEKYRIGVSIVNQLLDAGADPTRPDPARFRTPIESMLLILIENPHYQAKALNTAGGIFLRLIENQPGWVARIAQGHFDVLGIGWLGDMRAEHPALAQRLQQVATARLLEQATPTTPTGPKVRL